MLFINPFSRLILMKQTLWAVFLLRTHSNKKKKPRTQVWNEEEIEKQMEVISLTPTLVLLVLMEQDIYNHSSVCQSSKVEHPS